MTATMVLQDFDGVVPAADSVGRGFTRRFDNCAISVGKHLAKRAGGEIDNETQSGDSVGTDPYVL